LRGISNPIESPFAGHIIKAYLTGLPDRPTGQGYLTALYVLYRG
jgi:hypothetical protein